MVGHELQHEGWTLSETGPQDAEHTVLLLPGAMSTAAIYDDLITEPRFG